MLDYPQGFVSCALASETAVLHQTLLKMLQENVWQVSKKLYYSSRERVNIPKADPSEYVRYNGIMCWIQPHHLQT